MGEPKKSKSIQLLAKEYGINQEAATLNQVRLQKAFLDGAKAAFKESAEHCVCERFKTPGFDYGERHEKLGEPEQGKRWLTVEDLAARKLRMLN
jgi:uncharacterized Rossmann fold enzyme